MTAAQNRLPTVSGCIPTIESSPYWVYQHARANIRLAYTCLCHKGLKLKTEIAECAIERRRLPLPLAASFMHAANSNLNNAKI